jgi:signal transduction histidine kinase
VERPRRPSWTIRLRLTFVYGVLFLVTGLLLLTVTYVLVAHALPWDAIKAPPSPVKPSMPPALGPELQVPAPATDLQHELARQRAEYLRGLLVASGVALALLTFVAVWLGWLVAGRALRPLHAMAVTAKAISASDLHQRLSVPGPADEIKELADSFDGLLDHLEGAFEAQKRFVANASHELRTPLTFERSLLEVVLADPDASAADLREACERVLGSNQRQDKLIEALLTLARSQRGLNRRIHLDLAILAEEYLDFARAGATSGPRIEAKLEPALTMGDPPLVERLIRNLIDNAIRHNIPDGTVTVHTGIQTGLPTLVVRNTGPQITPGQIELIFQPFQRLRDTRLNEHTGHGIGLSIVAAITTAHDAELHAEPLPHGGLEVRISFQARENA